MLYRLFVSIIICMFVLSLSACSPSKSGPLNYDGSVVDGELNQNNCGPGESECDGVCVDIYTDPSHCGACGNQCNQIQEACINGVCTPFECTPGETEACYTGPPGTADNPPCQAGTRVCGADKFWGLCQDQVTPIPEVCYNGLDDNCDGITDEGCSCDEDLPSDSSDPLHYAMAMGICEFTTEDSEEWGLISASFSLADGTGEPNSNARSIRSGFGATQVQEGNKLVVLSSGHAAAQGDTNPDFAAFQSGVNLGTGSSVPQDWLDANGGNLPNAPGCPTPSDDGWANDPIMLTLRIRVPDNANSFSMRTNFFSAEYPQWVCSSFNDFFIVLLDSSYAGDSPNPADKNLAIYTAPDNTDYPIGVNLAFGNTGLFQQCLNGEAGCSGSQLTQITTCVGTDELVGTGFDIVSSGCGDNNLSGGGTGWLVTSGNVVPGEIITLRIAVWDTGDHILDSVALIDKFVWNMEVTDPGTIVN